MTPNSGQWDARIHYSVDLALGKLFLQKDGMCFMLTDFMAHEEGHDHNHSHDHDLDEVQRIHVIHQNFIGSNTKSKTQNYNPSKDLKNYFIGKDSSKWKSNIHSYNEVQYLNFYNNVDLIYKGENGQLSYNFLIDPGADVSQIKWSFDGAKKVFIRDGVLMISNRFGTIEQSAPIAYEIDESGHKSIFPIKVAKVQFLPTSVSQNLMHRELRYYTRLILVAVEMRHLIVWYVQTTESFLYTALQGLRISPWQALLTTIFLMAVLL